MTTTKIQHAHTLAMEAARLVEEAQKELAEGLKTLEGDASANLTYASHIAIELGESHKQLWVAIKKFGMG